ncbi:MAG: VOC family protein [Nitrospirae bacterium]|nr:VOC family protein [Candidatus Manganitrophaceae bacterium]
MSGKREPLPVRGLRHLALRVSNMETSRRFYQETLGMEVVWAPDRENIYLSFGADNLALHQTPPEGMFAPEAEQRLDHFGLIAENEAAVDTAFQRMEAAGVPIIKPLKRHRDGSYSFYMADPDGNVIQVLYEPHISRLF